MKTTKKDFSNFLLNDILSINYDNKVFTKKIEDNSVKILTDDKVIYELDRNNKVLYVLNAKYCSLNDENYFNIEQMINYKEYILDENTLIKVANVMKSR